MALKNLRMLGVALALATGTGCNIVQVGMPTDSGNGDETSTTDDGAATEPTTTAPTTTDTSGGGLDCPAGEIATCYYQVDAPDCWPQNQLGGATCTDAFNCGLYEYDKGACEAPKMPGECGNEVIDLGEGCDGENLDGFQCATVLGENFDNGVLTCSDTCFLDTSECTLCGDLKKEGLEQCDNGKVNNNDNNFCKADCTINICGDGFILIGTEECDNGRNNGSGKACTEDCEISVEPNAQ